MKLEVHNSHQHLLTFNTRLIVRWALAPFLQSPQANTCRSKAFIPIKIYSIINPNQAGGGKYARSKLKHYFSGTECRMYLKPSCKFKFVCCLETPWVPQNQPHRVYLGVLLGVNERPRGFLEPWQSTTMTTINVFQDVMRVSRMFF